jgi:hypothetical protein
MRSSCDGMVMMRLVVTEGVPACSVVVWFPPIRHRHGRVVSNCVKAGDPVSGHV